MKIKLFVVSLLAAFCLSFSFVLSSCDIFADDPKAEWTFSNESSRDITVYVSLTGGRDNFYLDSDCNTKRTYYDLYLESFDVSSNSDRVKVTQYERLFRFTDK